VAVGVGGSGVRVADRESPIHDQPGFGPTAHIKDPWGPKIELIKDPELLGFHHVHLFSADPGAALKWYQGMFGGKPGTLKARFNGVLYGKTWLLVSQNSNRGAL